MKPRRASREEKFSTEIDPASLLAESWRITVGPAGWIDDRSSVGKAFAALETDDGPVFLRRLPIGTSPRWLNAIHEATAFLDRAGFSLFPRFISTDAGDLAVLHGRRWFDLSVWPPGAPVRPESLSDAQLVNLARAIGRLHAAGEGAPGPAVRTDWLTATQASTQRLAWDPIARGKDAWQKPENLAGYYLGPASADLRVPSSETGREILDLARRTLARVGPAPLQALARQPPTLTHGDLWFDHVRFDGDTVTALLDLDTLGLRPPGGDVAALAADFALGDARRVELVIEAYRGERSLPPAAAAELPDLAALRALGVIRARWSRWLDQSDPVPIDDDLARATVFWRRQLHAFLRDEPEAGNHSAVTAGT